jgi:hypothetical protein
VFAKPEHIIIYETKDGSGFVIYNTFTGETKYSSTKDDVINNQN